MRRPFLKQFKKVSLFIFVLVFCFLILGGQLSFALSDDDINSIITNTVYYNPNDDSSSCSITADSATKGNTDYAGRQILTQGQLAQIAKNQPFYEQAAKKANIPWQMLAVVHLRETGLRRVNPAGGQGVYQYPGGEGGPYPTGPVSDVEFQRQTDFTAQYLKQKALSSNYPENKQLTASSDSKVIKDTFFSYNGRASIYKKQATSLGFSGNQGYEGSPYVMNKADAIRDPAVNKTTWGQVKIDHGGLVYPANNDYGAFVTYASLAGIHINCSDAVVSNGKLSWPKKAPGNISSCFGPRVLNGKAGNHEGLDIASGAGTPILSAGDGRVSFVGSGAGYGPHYVKIDHGSGVVTGYGHMSSATVSAGQDVKAGQQIGVEGNEGHSTGFHLHFNVIINGKNMDPLQYVTIPAGTTNPKGCK